MFSGLMMISAVISIIIVIKIPMTYAGSVGSAVGSTGQVVV
jgi:hypothetical protein